MLDVQQVGHLACRNLCDNNSERFTFSVTWRTPEKLARLSYTNFVIVVIIAVLVAVVVAVVSLRRQATEI